MKRVVVLALLAGCGDPGVDARPSEIVAPTVIAVTVEPPEAEAGTDVTVTVTVAGPDGNADASNAAWARCITPRAATDNNAVPTPCVTDDDAVEDLGDGATITAALSPDACALFGPNPPPGGFRARDPDPTGGYYQPLRVETYGEIGFAMARLRCGLANAPVQLVQQYADGYVDNVAPVITTLGVPATAGAAEAITLGVTWPAGTQEEFLSYDAADEALITATERLTVSWFVTGGEVDVDRSEGGELGASTTWTLPDEPGALHVWAVARDDRGGVAVIDGEVIVE